MAIRNKWLYLYVPWHMWGLSKMLYSSFWIECMYHKHQAWACIVATLYKATNFYRVIVLIWKPYLAKILESAVSNLDPVICNSYTHVSRLSSDIRHHGCVLVSYLWWGLKQVKRRKLWRLFPVCGIDTAALAVTCASNSVKVEL
jgi:hypothetical protein